MFKISGNFTKLRNDIDQINLFDFLKSKSPHIKEYIDDGENIGFLVENLLDKDDEELLLFYGKLSINNFEYSMEFRDTDLDHDIIKYESLTIKVNETEIVVNITFQEDAYPDFVCREILQTFRGIFSSLDV